MHVADHAVVLDWLIGQRRKSPLEGGGTRVAVAFNRMAWFRPCCDIPADFRWLPSIRTLRASLRKDDGHARRSVPVPPGVKLASHEPGGQTPASLGCRAF